MVPPPARPPRGAVTGLLPVAKPPRIVIVAKENGMRRVMASDKIVVTVKEEI